MELSDWDSLSFGPDGNSGSGIFIIDEWNLEIYKNWVYVRTPETIKNNGGFVNNTICHLTEGVLQLGPFIIFVKRGSRQDSVFVFAYCHKYNQELKESNYQFFAGIGCCGYKTFLESIKDLKIEIEIKKEDRWFETSRWDGNNSIYYYENQKGERIIIANNDKEYNEFMNNRFCGVQNETYQEFIEWLTVDVKEFMYNNENYNVWLNKIIEAKPQRFNQGDMFFAVNLGTDLQETEIEQAEMPVALQLMMNKEE